MVQCQNCGQVNNYASNFCRFCGTRMVIAQQNPPQQQNQSYEYNPPKPYSWKTDEFQVQDAKARKVQEINRVQPLSNFDQPPPQHLAYQQPQTMRHGYRCPRCGTQNLPIITSRISTLGWVIFGLLLFTVIFFWIGLLFKEDVNICPVCGLQLA